MDGVAEYATAHPLQPRGAFNIPVRRFFDELGGLKADKVNLIIDEETAVSPETGNACSLENYLALPDNTMDERIATARERLGATTILLGHHYQRDEVIRFADFTGDSYKLSKIAAETTPSTSCSAAFTSWRRAPMCSAAMNSRSSCRT